VLPAHQRFDGGHLLFRDVQQRLISHDELGTLYGPMQLHLHAKALHRALIDAAVVQMPAVSADPLARARGCIG